MLIRQILLKFHAKSLIFMFCGFNNCLWELDNHFGRRKRKMKILVKNKRVRISQDNF